MIEIWDRRWERALRIAAVLSVCLLMIGAVDRWTWGAWFQSVFVYFDRNLIQNVSSFYGSESLSYYLFTAAKAFAPPIFLLIVALALVGTFLEWRLMVILLVYVGAHLAVPHKELRFLIPIFPVLFILAAAGVQRARKIQLIFGTTLLVIYSIVHFRSLTTNDVGQGKYFAAESGALDREGSVNRLLLRAHRLDDLCGIEVDGVPTTLTGGFTYLHKKVPLYAETHHVTRESKFFNYVITRTPYSKDREIEKDGEFKLVRIFDGDCAKGRRYKFLAN